MFGIPIFCLLIFESSNLIYAVPLDGRTIERATNNEFPFIASLQTKTPDISDEDKHFCTGSLITMENILTAEHCITNVLSEEIQVVLGLTDVNSGYPTYDVEWMVAYDQWTHNVRVPKKFYDNDVAILRLSARVSQRTIRPVILAGMPTAHLYKTKAIVVGWALESNDTSFAQRLRKVNVDILTMDVCERQIYLVSNVRNTVERNQLCSIANPFALTSCGDSGGPLLDKSNRLIGVLAASCVEDEFRWGNFSEHFINKYEVNVHMSVELYREFINSVAGMD